VTLPVAVVVVTWNSAREIEKCLDSLPGVAEIVVVDNASCDQTAAVAASRHPRVRVLSNTENLGFAAAANQGVRATTSPLVLFLNPDAALADPLDPLVEALGEPGVAAAAGRLRDEAGSTQIGFNLRAFPTLGSLAAEALLLNRLWPSNPLNRRYRCLGLDHARPQDVDQPAGAFLMVRRDVLETVGGWDERFHPLWFEDVDLCLRIRRAGFRIRYVPACSARHQGGHSLARISVQDKQLYWYRSLLSYTDKHFSKPARSLVRAAVAVGALLRWFASWGRSEERRSYRTVLTLALGRRTAGTQVQPHALT
jgi:GT2 family glycosyltransferase